MIQVKFKNLEKSELAREAVQDRMENLIEKFPDLGQCRIQVILQMQNSPAQPGPDVFKVKVHVTSGRYKEITVEKASPNLYIALADVVDHMLETLNRYGDRARVKERRIARQIAQELEQNSQTPEEKFG